MSATARPSPESFLPLRAVEFQILVSLSRGECHGYRILQDAEQRGERGAVPGLATLYRALRRMQSEGLIARGETLATDDERRRTFRLTDLGQAVGQLEASRLEALVESARGGLLAAKGSQR